MNIGFMIILSNPNVHIYTCKWCVCAHVRVVCVCVHMCVTYTYVRNCKTQNNYILCMSHACIYVLVWRWFIWGVIWAIWQGTMHIPYSTKFWQEKTLANLANQSYFANILPLQIYLLTYFKQKNCQNFPHQHP